MKDNFYKLILVISVLLVSLAIVYYYFVYLPQINNNKLQGERWASEIIKECETLSSSQAWETPKNRFLPKTFDEEKYDLLYKQCLRSRGLK
jgi:hypothetical protein